MKLDAALRFCLETALPVSGMWAKCGQKRILSGLTTEEIPDQRQKETVPLEGLEPPTVSLGRNCSSIELQRLARRVYRTPSHSLPKKIAIQCCYLPVLMLTMYR